MMQAAVSRAMRLLPGGVLPVVVLCCLALGCLTTGKPVAPARPEARTSPCRELSWTFRPGAGEHRFRVRVRAREREMLLLGILLVEPGKRFRAVAIDQVGGRVFDVSVTPETVVLRYRAPFLPEKILREGIARDLRSLFLEAPDGPAWRCQRTAGCPGKECLSCRRREEGCGRRTLLLWTCQGPVPPPAEAGRCILLRNHRFHYSFFLEPLPLSTRNHAGAGTSRFPPARRVVPHPTGRR